MKRWLLLTLCFVVFAFSAEATTVYFNTTNVGTGTFRGAHVDGYNWWQYNLGKAPIAIASQTVYLTVFSPSGNDCSSPPASGSVNILTYGQTEPTFGAYGTTVPSGHGFSLPTYIGTTSATGGCYITYAFDGANWTKPSWNWGDWVAVETGGTDLATDSSALLSSAYNGNARDVNVGGAWACMTDDGNYSACLSGYHFSGFQSPLDVDGSGGYTLGKTLSVKFQITDGSGTVITSPTANIVVASVSSGVVSGTPTVSASFSTSGNQYVYSLSTGSLSQGDWLIEVILDDGTSYSELISLR